MTVKPSVSIIGDGTFKVTPRDPTYEDIKRHVGGIEPGEIKPFPPWPEADEPPRDKPLE